MLNEPDAVGTHEKPMPIASHRLGRDLQDECPSAPLTDPHRGLERRGKVNVMTLPLTKTLRTDDPKELCDCPVIEHGRRLAGDVTEVDVHRVTLVRADQGPVLAESKTLLVAPANDLLKLGARDRCAVAGEGIQELDDVGPPGLVESDADPPRFVAEHERQEPAEVTCAAGVHESAA
jgi:hypothetical protein